MQEGSSKVQIGKMFKSGNESESYFEEILHIAFSVFLSFKCWIRKRYVQCWNIIYHWHWISAGLQFPFSLVSRMTLSNELAEWLSREKNDKFLNLLNAKLKHGKPRMLTYEEAFPHIQDCNQREHSAFARQIGQKPFDVITTILIIMVICWLKKSGQK